MNNEAPNTPPAPMDREFARYLKLLNLRQEAPSISALEQLVRSHMALIPFENLSKIHALRTTGSQYIPDLTQFLDGIEQFHVGGTCYATNFHLHQLLTFLGYEAALCGADMSKPDVHLVNLVTVEGREFLVDVGYAAPLWRPLPRDLSTDVKIALGEDEYVLSPRDATGRSRLTLMRGGAPRHGYYINPRPRHIGEFTRVIEQSYRPESTFMKSLLITRYAEPSSAVIHNMSLLELRSSSVTRKDFHSIDELIAGIEMVYGIPQSYVRTVLEGMEFTADAWG